MNFHLNQSKFIQIYILYVTLIDNLIELGVVGYLKQVTAISELFRFVSGKTKTKPKAVKIHAMPGKFRTLRELHAPSRGRTGHPVQGAISMGMLQ